MARTAYIISTTGAYMRITEKDGTAILSDTFDALGNWTVKVEGNSDLTNPDSMLIFYSSVNQFHVGAVKFSEVTSILLNGVESITDYSNHAEMLDDIKGQVFGNYVSVTNLSSLATSAKQSELLAQIGANVAPTAGSVNARLDAIEDKLDTLLLCLDGGSRQIRVNVIP